MGAFLFAEGGRMDSANNRPFSQIQGETLIDGGGLAAGMVMITVVSGITGLAWGATSVGAVADAIAFASGYGTYRSLKS